MVTLPSRARARTRRGSSSHGGRSLSSGGRGFARRSHASPGPSSRADLAREPAANPAARPARADAAPAESRRAAAAPDDAASRRHRGDPRFAPRRRSLAGLSAARVRSGRSFTRRSQRGDSRVAPPGADARRGREGSAHTRCRRSRLPVRRRPRRGHRGSVAVAGGAGPLVADRCPSLRRELGRPPHDPGHRDGARDPDSRGGA